MREKNDATSRKSNKVSGLFSMIIGIKHIIPIIESIYTLSFDHADWVLRWVGKFDFEEIKRLG